MTIGIVIFDLYNKFFAMLLDEIITCAHAKGFFADITLSNKDKMLEYECIGHLSSGRCDGLILCPINQDPSFTEYLQSLGVPIVNVVNALPGSPFSFVGMDDERAMQDATHYVISRQYERIGYCQGFFAKRGCRLVASSYPATGLESGIFASSRYFMLM